VRPIGLDPRLEASSWHIRAAQEREKLPPRGAGYLRKNTK
jgi:hypothetical protein